MNACVGGTGRRVPPGRSPLTQEYMPPLLDLATCPAEVLSKAEVSGGMSDPDVVDPNCRGHREISEIADLNRERGGRAP